MLIGKHPREAEELLIAGSGFLNDRLYGKALANFLKAAKLFRAIGNHYWTGAAYHYAGNVYLDVARDSLHPVPDDSLFPKTKRAILEQAQYYFKHAQYQYWLNKGERKLFGPTEAEINLLKDQADACYMEGNFEVYKIFRREYDKYNGNLAIIDSSVRIAASELKSGYKRQQDSLSYESEKKRLLYEKEAQLSALKYEFDKKQALAKSESERQQLSLEEAVKRKQIEAAYARKQEQDSARQERENEAQQSQVRFLRQRDELTRSKLRQQGLYSVIAFIGLCLVGSLFFFRYRLRHLRLKGELAGEKAAMQLREAAYKSKMNDIAFTALRAQMNPHFIFNCLNSIKLYTEQNNTEAASQYLTKFSKLIRNMLDSGRAENIVLSKELESLRLYLEMEAMRFKQKLRYTIHVDPEIDSEFIEIPPLLIQPYVENAIWHGLMHKEEGGTIRIHVSQSERRTLLIITIEDDGVGREKAAAIRSKTAVQHKSHGTRVTGERIALINEKYGLGAEAVTTDLLGPERQPAGTLVTIKLPIK